MNTFLKSFKDIIKLEIVSVQTNVDMWNESTKHVRGMTMDLPS